MYGGVCLKIIHGACITCMVWSWHQGCWFIWSSAGPRAERASRGASINYEMVPIWSINEALWAAPLGLWFSSQTTIQNLRASKASSIFAVIVVVSPTFSDVTEVDFIHVHKGSPTLGSPWRRLLLVCAIVTTTNKGQSPMVMANWVCSHYWPSEQWSTDGELASLTQLTLQP